MKIYGVGWNIFERRFERLRTAMTQGRGLLGGISPKQKMLQTHYERIADATSYVTSLMKRLVRGQLCKAYSEETCTLGLEQERVTVGYCISSYHV